jgi:cytosine/adenosine deaminase-related metal-dependent hydrolase
VVGLSRERTLLAADWIFPITSAPIENGGLLVENGIVIDLGPLAAVEARHTGIPAERLPPGAVMPGLVNAHTHMELAALDRVPAAESFAAWASRVIAAKENLTPDVIRDGVRRAAERLRESGTVHVADISNFAISAGVLAGAGLSATVFNEFIGMDSALFDEWEAELHGGNADGGARHAVRIAAAGHTPFSTGPGLIKRCARRAADRDEPWSLHLAESADETEYLVHGGGPLADLLSDRGIEGADVSVPGMRSVPYMETLGCLDERLVAVHLVQIDDDDIDLLARRGVRPCLCPSSNLHIAGRLPPAAAMLAAGLRPALGTDSPVSSEGFDLFREMEILLDAGLDAAILLSMATLHGAEALRLEADLGRIEKGRQPALIHLAFETEPGPAGDSTVDAVRAGQAQAAAIRAGVQGRVAPLASM